MENISVAKKRGGFENIFFLGERVWFKFFFFFLEKSCHLWFWNYRGIPGRMEAVQLEKGIRRRIFFLQLRLKWRALMQHIIILTWQKQFIHWQKYKICAWFYFFIFTVLKNMISEMLWLTEFSKCHKGFAGNFSVRKSVLSFCLHFFFCNLKRSSLYGKMNPDSGNGVASPLCLIIADFSEFIKCTETCIYHFFLHYKAHFIFQKKKKKWQHVL